MLDQYISKLKKPSLGIVVTQDKNQKIFEDNNLIKWEYFTCVDDALEYILSDNNIEDIEVIIVDSSLEDRDKIIKNSQITDGKLTLVLDIGKLKKEELEKYNIYDESSLEKISNNIHNYLISQQKLKAEKIKKVIEAKKILHSNLQNLINAKDDKEIKQLIDNIYDIDSTSTKDHIYRTYLAYKHYLDSMLTRELENDNYSEIRDILLENDYEKLQNSGFSSKIKDDIVEKYSKAIVLHDIGKIYIDERVLDSNIAFRLDEIARNKIHLYNRVDSSKFNDIKFMMIKYIENHIKVSHMLLDSQSRYFKSDEKYQDFLQLSLYMAAAHHNGYLEAINKEKGIYNRNIEVNRDVSKIKSIALAEGVDQFEAMFSERSYKEAIDITDIIVKEKINIEPQYLNDLINKDKELFFDTYRFVYNNIENIKNFSIESQLNILNNLKKMNEIDGKNVEIYIKIEENEITRTDFQDV